MKQHQPTYVKQCGTRYMASRECYRLSFHDAKMSHRIFERIRDSSHIMTKLRSTQLFPGAPITCNPNLRMYKYEPGMSFGKHIDESNIIPGQGITRVTVLIYLSDCEGGATRFESNVAFEPRQGSILLHVHGEEWCLEHEADPVVSGTKYVLRTDLVYK